MTKAEIVTKISEKTGLEKAEVLVTIETFMNEVKYSLQKDENVYLRGFGSFIVKRRAEKTGRNISKNTTIKIPAHNIPAFKPAKVFVNGVKSNVAAKQPLYKLLNTYSMPSGKKKKRKKIATHKRKKRSRRNRHKKK